MSETSDVIVIGAGIAGASVAAELAQDGSVTVLEMEERPGYHSTSRSAATWAPSYGPPVIMALAKASGPFLHAPPEGFCQTPLTETRDEMILGLPGDEAEIDAFRALGMQEITLDEARERIPQLRTQVISCVLFDGSCRDLDVDALHQGFLRQLRRRGGSVHCDVAAETFAYSKGKWQVTTSKGVFSAPVIVNAAGAWADEVAKLAGLTPVGLQPKRRSAALITPPDGVDIDLWPLAMGTGETFYFKPMSGKLVVSPADVTPVEPHDAWADDLLLAEAIDHFQRHVDFEVKRLDHTWGGLRTFAPDGDPVAGFDATAKGFFWLAGQGGYGIMTSPALSRVAAALVQGLDIPEDIAGYGVSKEQLSPQRFG